MHKAERAYRLSIPASLDKLSTLRHWLEETLRSHSSLGVSDEQVFHIQLAVQEAAVNVVRHSGFADTNQAIDVTVTIADQIVAIELLYEGVEFGGTAPPPDFDSPGEGGFGLFIISQAMDEVEYGRSTSSRNFIRLKKQLSTKEVDTHDRN